MSYSRLVKKLGCFVIALFASFQIAKADVPLTPIIIGDINNYAQGTSSLQSYQNGMRLAAEEINKSGGVANRNIKLIFKDDAGSRSLALRHARDLIEIDKTDFITGGTREDISIALSDFAAQHRTLYFSSLSHNNDLIWQNGNKYCFSLRPTTQIHIAILANVAAKLNVQKWSIVAQNDRYGRYASELFQDYLQENIEGISVSKPIYINEAETNITTLLQSLKNQKTDAILLLVKDTSNLRNLLNEGKKRKIFDEKTVLSPFLGNPEYRTELSGLIPDNWIVTGYPQETLSSGYHDTFKGQYRHKYQKDPDMSALLGYTLVRVIARGYGVADAANNIGLIEAYRNLAFISPLGPATIRAADHQSTLGTYVGLTQTVNGQIKMINIQYISAEKYMPKEYFTKKYLRNKKAQ